MSKKHIGSTFDDFLEEEGLLEESESVAAKRVFVYQLEKELEKQRVSRSDLAEKIAYYLRHDSEAEKIRKAGCRRARSEHTWQKRFKRVFREIGLG